MISSEQIDWAVKKVKSSDKQYKCSALDNMSICHNKDILYKIFIDEDYKETLKYRKMRNRGNEVKDPFVEGILETEHKIIAGHKFLADIIITKEYEVISVE